MANFAFIFMTCTQFGQVPQDPSVLKKNIYYCSSCSQYLPSTEFPLSSNSRSVGRCRQCGKKNNDAIIRQDHSHFRYLLKNVCRAEEQFGDGSNIAFLMQARIFFAIYSLLRLKSHCYNWNNFQRFSKWMKQRVACYGEGERDITSFDTDHDKPLDSTRRMHTSYIMQLLPPFDPPPSFPGN